MKEKKTSVSTKRVLQYVREQYKLFPKQGIISLVSRVITIGLDLLPAVFYKDIINVLSNTVASSEIAAHALAILMYLFWVKLIQAIIMRVFDYFMVTMEMDINENLYNEFFSYFQNHSFQFFSDNFTGSLISKIRKAVGAVERLSDELSFSVIPFLLNVVLMLVIIGMQSIRIAGGFFIVIVLCCRAQYKLYLRIYPYQEEANNLDSKLSGVLSDDITNSFNIKIFASLSREMKTFANITHTTFKAWKTLFYKSMWIWGISRGLTGLILEVGTLYIAILLRGKGVLEIGVIVLLQTYVARIIQYLGGMGNTFRHLFRSVAEIGEVVEIIDIPHSVVDKTDKKLKISAGEIIFDAVDFSYDGENKVFDQLSLKIKPGERIGLV
ncbi:MAG: ABC transporter ATP-binding protein/permease [Candidatus Peribacteria bacterium]|jgi:ATP-binding cassette subfamily B protein|nr:ABC transporter ATP-binding protein/permease [Candidatus Peribacteria bacterium]